MPTASPTQPVTRRDEDSGRVHFNSFTSDKRHDEAMALLGNQLGKSLIRLKNVGEVPQEAFSQLERIPNRNKTIRAEISIRGCSVGCVLPNRSRYEGPIRRLGYVSSTRTPPSPPLASARVVAVLSLHLGRSCLKKSLTMGQPSPPIATDTSLSLPQTPPKSRMQKRGRRSGVDS
jgi:hypothetical protein